MIWYIIKKIGYSTFSWNSDCDLKGRFFKNNNYVFFPLTIRIYFLCNAIYSEIKYFHHLDTDC